MTTRYKKLRNLPDDLLSKVYDEYHKFISGTSLKALVGDKNKIKTIQPKLTMIPIPVDFGIPEIFPQMIVLITEPNSGMGIVHTDKSRLGGINIPLKVELETCPYIALKEEYLDTIGPGVEFELDGKKGRTWEYDPEKFENVYLDAPLFVNTSLPHSWNNASNNYRVLASLFFHEIDAEKCAEIVEKWS